MADVVNKALDVVMVMTCEFSVSSECVSFEKCSSAV